MDLAHIDVQIAAISQISDYVKHYAYFNLILQKCRSRHALVLRNRSETVAVCPPETCNQ